MEYLWDLLWRKQWLVEFVSGVKEATSFIVLSSWMRSAGVFSASCSASVGGLDATMV